MCYKTHLEEDMGLVRYKKRNNLGLDCFFPSKDHSHTPQSQHFPHSCQHQYRQCRRRRRRHHLRNQQ
jgi:hypothetical protein